MSNSSNIHRSTIVLLLNIAYSMRETVWGFIDVGNGWWRPNVLMTSLRCWWPIQDVDDRFNSRENHQNNEKSRRHNDSACQNLPSTCEMSPTSLSPSTVMAEFTRVTLMMKGLFDYPSTTFDLENVIFILNWHASWPEYNLQPFISHFKSFAELGIQRICIFYL